MLSVYTALSRLIYAASYPVARLKAARGNRLWSDRLAKSHAAAKADIWLHAASAGEARIIGYLIDYLLAARPGLHLHATVMTHAGHKVASDMYPDKVNVSYFPLDAPAPMRRFIKSLQPKMIVMAETEIWPNMILTAHKKHIALVLVNGRMSERGFRRYKWVRKSVASLLKTYEHFFFKTDSDALRFFELGVDKSRATVAGDMKFDAPLPQRLEGRRREIRSRLGFDESSLVFVAGSTRPGEEEMLANVYQRLSMKFENFRMVVAPRHLDRVGEVTAILEAQSPSVMRYGNCDGRSRIVVVDCIGILNDLYLAADIAFVGGTLVDIGGHNLLEPVWAGTPVLYGPFLTNVRDAAEYIELNQFGACVANPEILAIALEEFFQGRRRFARKSETDTKNSPTATAGDYILKYLNHA